MRQFGTEECGDRNTFKLICCNCGSEADITTTHHYEVQEDYGEFKVKKITLNFRCLLCNNEFSTTIHKKIK